MVNGINLNSFDENTIYDPGNSYFFAYIAYFSSICSYIDWNVLSESYIDVIAVILYNNNK